MLSYGNWGRTGEGGAVEQVFSQGFEGDGVAKLLGFFFPLQISSCRPIEPAVRDYSRVK